MFFRTHTLIFHNQSTEDDTNQLFYGQMEKLKKVIDLNAIFKDTSSKVTWQDDIKTTILMQISTRYRTIDLPPTSIFSQQ